VFLYFLARRRGECSWRSDVSSLKAGSLVQELRREKGGYKKGWGREKERSSSGSGDRKDAENDPIGSQPGGKKSKGERDPGDHFSEAAGKVHLVSRETLAAGHIVAVYR